MVVKNMDIWAISGNNHNITATLYSNQVIIQNLKVEKKKDSSFEKNYKKEYSLHLNTS